MGIAEGYNARTSRMQLEELRQNRLAELGKAGYTQNADGSLNIIPNSNADVEQAKNTEALQLAKSLQARLAAQDTDNAIADYVHSGDATQLQKALDNNAFLKNAWAQRGVQVVQNVDWNNDGQLLATVGLKPEMYDTPEKQKQLQRGIYKYYDGKEYHLGSVNNLIAETGAMSRLGSQRSSMIMEHMQGIANALKGSSNQMEQTKIDIEKQNADSNTMNAGTNAYNAQTNRQAATWSHAENMAQLDVRRLEAAVKLRAEGSTATQKDLAAADQLTGDLLQEFGASYDNTEAFFKTDFSKPENFQKGYRFISKIEKLEGVQLTTDDKAKIAEARQMIALADPASKLGSSDTGIIDKKFADVERYLTDTVGGTRARAAWTAFRNIARRAMSGQALTEHEIKANEEAMGALGEQLGPTLAKFQTSLIQVKAQIESFNTVMNPYSVKVRLGADQEKLNSIMGNIDKTLQYMDGAAAKQATSLGNKPKRSLTDIFGD